MRHKILILAVLAAASVPLGAQAQQRVIVDEGTTTGMAGVPVGGGIITETQRPRFRQ